MSGFQMTMRSPVVRTTPVLSVVLLVLTMCASPGSAQDRGDDSSRARMSIAIERSDSIHWRAEVSLLNEDVLAAMTLPLEWYGEGFMIDSASYYGTRVDYFALKTYLVDSVAHSVLIGLIPDLGMGLPMLEPGNGVIALLHFTGPPNPSEPFRIDSTFIRPHNTLQLVTPDVRSITPALEIIRDSVSP